jgi:hypothetical protein
MMEDQKTQHFQSRGSMVICSDCGTIYDQRRPSTHPEQECLAAQAWIDADSLEPTPRRRP